MNGVSLLDFKFELMTCIYHLKNIMFWDLFGCLFSPSQTGAIEDHSGVGKYQGNTLTCRRFIVLAMVRAHWKSYSPPKKEKKKRGWTENLLHHLQGWDNVQLCVSTSLVGLSGWVGARTTRCDFEIVGWVAYIVSMRARILLESVPDRADSLLMSAGSCGVRPACRLPRRQAPSWMIYHRIVVD